jgi:hypothetical protein
MLWEIRVVPSEILEKTIMSLPGNDPIRNSRFPKNMTFLEFIPDR